MNLLSKFSIQDIAIRPSSYKMKSTLQHFVVGVIMKGLNSSQMSQDQRNKEYESLDQASLAILVEKEKFPPEPKRNYFVFSCFIDQNLDENQFVINPIDFYSFQKFLNAQLNLVLKERKRSAFIAAIQFGKFGENYSQA